MKLELFSEFIIQDPEGLADFFSNKHALSDEILEKEYFIGESAYFSSISKLIESIDEEFKNGITVNHLYIPVEKIEPDAVLFEFTEEEYAELKKYQLIEG